MSGAKALLAVVSLVSVLGMACAGGAAGGPGSETATSPASDTETASASKKPHDAGLDSLEALKQKLKAPGTKELDLAAKAWGSELGKLLGDASTLGELTRLDISDNDLGDAGARGLLGSSHLGNLVELDLGGNEIGDDGAKAVASGKLERLMTLNL